MTRRVFLYQIRTTSRLLDEGAFCTCTPSISGFGGGLLVVILRRKSCGPKYTTKGVCLVPYHKSSNERVMVRELPEMSSSGSPLSTVIVKIRQGFRQELKKKHMLRLWSLVIHSVVGTVPVSDSTQLIVESIACRI